MFWALMVLEVIVSILLTAVVLMQASKGGGLAGTLGGGQVSMVFGVRRTADFLTRATQVLGAVFMVLALVINIFFLPRGGVDVESVIQRGASQQAPAPSLPQELPSVPQQGPPQTPPPQQ